MRSQSILPALTLLLIFSLLAGGISAQGEPEGANAVWMNEAASVVGSSFSYPVFLKNNVAIGRIVLPLDFSHPAHIMILDSISLSGGRLEGLGTAEFFVNNIAQEICLSFQADVSTPVPAGEGMIANLYFRISHSADPQEIEIDTAFVFPDKFFTVESDAGVPVGADFGKGLIDIISVLPIIHLEPDSFFFATTAGIDPPAQLLTITNLGIEPLTWLMPIFPDWVFPTATIGIAPSEVQLTPHVDGLSAGIYFDSLQIRDFDRPTKYRWAYLTLEITPAQGTGLAGEVIDPTESPIENAVVEVWDDFNSGSLLFTTNSAPDGSFLFETVPDGSYRLYAYKDHYYPTLMDVTSPDEDIVVVLEPTSDPTPGVESISLWCDENYFDNNLLPIGSVVEAFDQGGTLCGQYFVDVTGEYGLMTVHRDNPATPSDEGADSNEVLVIKINQQVASAYPAPIWSYDGDVQQICLNTIIEETVCIDLTAGWNLVSWNIDTDNDAIEGIVTDISDCINVVLAFEQGGATYDPDLPQFSTLEFADHLHGYWFRMNCPAQLCVSGPRVNPRTPIELEENWNLVSYLPTDSDSTANALTTILDDLVIALGFQGGALTYDPLLPGASDLYELEPKLGYWLKTSAAGSLIYPGPPLAGPYYYSATMTMKSHAQSSNINPTPEWISFYGDGVTFDGALIPSGSILEVYDEAGNLCGEYHIEVSGIVPFVPVYLDDQSTAIDEGASRGSLLTIAIDGAVADQSFAWSERGDRVELRGLTSAEKENVSLPRQFGLAQNYPNPFNPETVIRFALPVTSKVSLEIYNVLGERVVTLINSHLSAGYHEVRWDGKFADGESATSGVYFYRLKAGNLSETKKMVLMK